MTFFYDLNKKLDTIREKPEVTHKQLNERDEGKPGKNFAKIAKDAGERYGSKAAGERVAGAVRNKLKAQGKLEEEQVNELSPDTLNSYADKAKGQRGHAFGRMQAAQQGNQAADPTGKFAKTWDKRATGYNKAVAKGANDLDKSGTRSTWNYDQDMEESAFQAAIGKKKYGEEGMKALQKAGRDHASAKTMSNIRNKYDKYDESMEEGVMDTVKSVGKKVAGGINKLVGHGSDEDMRRDVQRKAGVPPTGKMPQQQVKEKLSPAKQKSFAALAPPADKITFADKIAGAKKEVDEMLGDVAAEAMRSALGGGKGRNAEMDEERSKGTAFDMSTSRAAAPKVGSIERGHKHDIKHTATGRMVTRRVDNQGNSVGADDDSDTQAGPRGRGRPKGTKGAIGAKGPSGRSKLMTKEGEVDIRDQGEYDQEGDMAKDDIKTIVRHAQALNKILGDNDNLPEWVQSKLAKIEGMMVSIDEYMQNQEGDDSEEQELDEKAVSKKQQRFMGMVHAAQKGEKPASKEVGKVAKTMKKKDAEDFASTKHKGLPEKAPKKKKEEEVEESSTTSGSVATSTAAPKSNGGMSFGKGIYDSMNRELENMIAESMSINMSDSTEGGKSLTVTATDEDAMRLAVMLKSAGLGGQGRELQNTDHSHGEEPCETCGMADCGCGDVQEAVDENAPDWPTNTETSDNALQYAGGLNKPKSSSMATIPVTDVQVDGEDMFSKPVHEDEIRRMMEMAGIKQAELEPWKETMKEEADDVCSDCHKDPCECEESVEESIQRMREIAGIKEAKKPDFLDMDKDGDKKEPMTKAIKDKEEKKVEESIFALTNQWKAYRG
jgi:hypothetical protein